MSANTEKGRVLLAVSGWDPLVWLRELQEAAPDRAVVLEPAGENDPSIEYAVVWKQKPGILSNLPNLKAIFSMGAGVDHLFRDPDLPAVPIVRSIADDLTMRMSEYVVWQVLDHLRQGNSYRRQQREKIWQELPQPAAGDVIIGIMGFGVLGKDAARALRALGFRLAGWSRTPKEIEGVACHHGQAGFADFLQESDIVVVLLPLTPATRGILNTNMFSAMKRDTPLGGPVLINAGRGGLQVETDIVEALDDGRLMAASLDVFEHEPLPSDNPLWNHPRVTITPHAAASSDPRRLIPPMVQQMEDHDKGMPLANLVDRGAGY